MNKYYLSSADIAAYLIDSWSKCISGDVPRKIQIDSIDYRQINNSKLNIYLFRELVSSVNHIMEEKFIFLLTDKNTVLLDLVCSTEVKNNLEEAGIMKGFVFSERSAGTNAVSLSSKFKKPIYLEPKYHYCNIFKSWYSFALPLERIDNITGYLCVTTENQQLNKNIVVIGKLLAYKIASRSSSKKCNIKKIYTLSERQLQVLRLIAGGLTEQGVADRLKLSINTIKYHKKVLFEVLNVQSVIAAVVRSLKLGLITVDEINLS